MKRDSTKARRICFDAHKFVGPLGRPIMRCHYCHGFIDPVRDQWRADHIRRHAEGGEDTAENLWPIHLTCDVEFKAPNDTKEVAKGKRASNKHFNIERKQSRSSFRKKPPGTKFDWNAGRYVRVGGEDE